MPEVFRTTDEVVEIGSGWLGTLKQAAEQSPLRRARVCLHVENDSAVQEMILVLCQDVLFRPHRHLNKTESFHIIEGELDVIVFDPDGKPIRTLRMGPPGSGRTFCYRLNSSLYHALLPRTPFVVFHETTAGPFRKDDAQFADWAPEDPTELRAFLERAVRTEVVGDESRPEGSVRGAGTTAVSRDVVEQGVTRSASAPLTHTRSTAQRPDRVVVLGGDGFLGRAIYQRLMANDIETISLTSRDLDLAGPEAGTALAEMVRPTDALIMLAAVKPGRHQDEEAFAANLAMGSTLCRAVRQRGCAHLLYVSSDAVYPFAPEPIRENVTPAPSSLYAQMHLARETMLSGTGAVPTALLRLTQVYGPGDPHDAYGPNRMVRSALRDGRIVLYGSGEETRDHIHVADVTAVVLDVLMIRSRGLINLASGRSVSFAALADMVRGLCNGRVRIDHEPRRMPVLHRSFDTAALDAAFPMRMRTSLEAGIAAMLEAERAGRGSGLDPGTTAKADGYARSRCESAVLASSVSEPGESR